MRCKVPGYVDILLKKTEVETAATNMHQLPNFSRVHYFFDLSNGWGIYERVSDHKGERGLLRDFN